MKTILRHIVIIAAGLALLMPSAGFSQDDEAVGTSSRKNRINSGFYFSIGPVFPMGTYAYDQVVYPTSGPRSVPGTGLNYLAARIGGAFDMGFLIYFGPAFANNHLRAGLDATFLSLWFNSTKPKDPNKPTDHYYWYGGQKFGPVFTINPVDRLNIDIAYKINANFAYHYDEWSAYPESNFSKYGMNIFRSEVSVSVRYSVMLFSAQYSFGKMKYDNFDKDRPTQTIQTDVFKIMIGIKI
jgi:hypothetical protein